MVESKSYVFVFNSKGDIKVAKEPTSFPGSYLDAFLNLAEELFGYCDDFLIMEEDVITDPYTYPFCFLYKDRDTGEYLWDSYASTKRRFPNLDQLMDKAKALHFLI